MRSCEHMEKNRHLKVVTRRDGELVGLKQSVCDPFHTTTVVLGWSLREWLAMLFRRDRTTTIVVSVEADRVAMDRWFKGQDTCEKCSSTKIGPLPGVHETDPGYHHGNERWCEACYYDYTPAESVAAGLCSEGKIQ